MNETVFNIHDVILLMTTFLCVLFACLLLTIDSGKRRSNLFLALFLLQHAAIPMDILISFGAEFRAIALSFSPNLFYVFGFGYWLEAPLLLWYVRSLVYKSYHLQWRDLIYLLPFVLYLLHQLVFYYSLGATWREQELANYDINLAPSYIHWVTLGRELFRVALGVLCIYELKAYRRHLETNFSSIGRHELSWLSILVIGYTMLRAWSVLVLVFVILNIVFAIEVDFEVMGLIGNYTSFLLTSLMIFFSLGHSSIYEGLDRQESQSNESNENQEALNPELGKKVRLLMEKDKVYLNSNLTLERLANTAGIPEKLLSGVINRQLNCNFFVLVNGYRIEEAKKRLTENPDQTILDVLFDSGFNSKTTFNTLFKKKVGLTPTEYRNRGVRKFNLQN